MGTLTAAGRKRLKPSSFAGPDKSYPDEDIGHAKAALSRVAANGSPAVKKEVRAKVAAKYPSMKVRGKPDKHDQPRFPKIAKEYT